MPTGHIEIFLADDADDPSVIATPRVATGEVLTRLKILGIDTNKLNKVFWPTGASRYAEASFLLHKQDLDNLFPSVIGPNGLQAAELVLKYGQEELKFHNLFMLPPLPIMVTESNDSLYLIKFVDIRKGWSRAASNKSYNVTRQINRSKFVKNTVIEVEEDSSDSPPVEEHTRPWQVNEIIDDLFDQLLQLNLIHEAQLPFIPADPEHPSFDELLHHDYIRDLQATTVSIPQLIDKLLAGCGNMLVAFPAFDEQPAKFEIVPIDEDYGITEILLENLDFVIGGGYFANQKEGLTGPTGSFQRNLAGNARLISTSMPANVIVSFPKEILVQGDITASEDFTGNWHSETTNAGKPTSRPGSIPDFEFTSGYWALAHGTNLDDLEAYADILSEAYYRRFKSTIGDISFGTFVHIRNPGGNDYIEWGLSSDDLIPFTRVNSSFDSEILKFEQNTPRDYNIDDIRVIPQIGGGSTFARSPDTEIRLCVLGNVTPVDSEEDPPSAWLYQFREVQPVWPLDEEGNRADGFPDWYYRHELLGGWSSFDEDGIDINKAINLREQIELDDFENIECPEDLGEVERLACPHIMTLPVILPKPDPNNINCEDLKIPVERPYIVKITRTRMYECYDQESPPDHTEDKQGFIYTFEAPNPLCNECPEESP